MICVIIKTPSLREELCYSSASLLDRASRTRCYNKEASASSGEPCYSGFLSRGGKPACRQTGEARRHNNLNIMPLLGESPPHRFSRQLAASKKGGNENGLGEGKEERDYL